MFKIDFIDGDAVTWEKTETGVQAERYRDYHPRFYIEGDKSKLQKSRAWLSRQEGVVATCFETWRPTLSKPEKQVLRVDASSNEKLKQVVYRLKKGFGRSTFRFYNVGLSPQFRFCLQNEICPVPDQELERVKLSLPRRHLANNEIQYLELNGDRLGRSEAEVLQELRDRWREVDPDIVQVSRGALLKLIRGKIEEHDLDFSLGRMNNFQKLAGENTVSSYGRTQHSASRYNIPGRILIDESNSFMLGEATLEGLWDLVERSYRPMQELAWGSIGRILTSIEVKQAYLKENTLTPWKNWSGEQPKKASTMHKADRGGFIFNPEPSIHFDVYEADFASLFPNIMVKRNISPETVCCTCCDNNRVPELDYSICEKREGFIGKVLRPLVEDRQEMKEELRDFDGQEERRKYLQGSVDALKNVLITCFGYMGHAHASYGAIKCHQAIQAFDRDIMVRTKEMFEKSSYSVAHGIIDSIWVQEGEDADDFEEVCDMIYDEIGIELEPEHKFEWVAFVPRTDSPGISTLNRYFGRRANGDIKTAGIEVEQRTTCSFVADAQMEMIEALDEEIQDERETNEQAINEHAINEHAINKQASNEYVGKVLEVVREKTRELEQGKVPVNELVRTKKASKPLEAYSVENRTVQTLKRAREYGIDIKAGQDIKIIVRDNDVDGMDRVRLAFEAEEGEYDTEFYIDQLVKACESILSPLGLDRENIRERLYSSTLSLSSFS